MKKSAYILYLILICIMFTSCKKWFDEPNSGEDLSYIIRTYYCYEANNHFYKTVWTYDGHKETSCQSFVDGQLAWEQKNYSYDGLNASWDYYSYMNNNVNDISVHKHVECEYLDKTFQRVKFQREDFYFADSQSNYISVIYREFDGKKCVGFKRYKNGVLTAEGHDFHYDGLHCASITTKYSSDIPNVVKEETSFSTVYLDDSYLRTKSITRTNERFYEDGTSTISTRYEVNDYDGMKPIGYQLFYNDKLNSVQRDYQYDGLSCRYYGDSYRDGEVYATMSYEVEYLE